MSTQTTNYNLEKPSQDEKYDIDVHNGNMDVIDSKLSELNEWKGARQFIITATNGNTHSAYPIGISCSSIGSNNRTQSGQSNNTAFPIYGTVLTVNKGTSRCYQIVYENGHVDKHNAYMRYFYVDTWGAWRKVIQEDSKELTRYTLADFGLTNASFAGKTWEQCALIIVNACPASRVIQYISPHTENYENIAIALSNEGLHNLGTLRFEAGKESLNRDIPNKFEYNGNNGNGIFVGFYDNVWRGWRRLDTGEVQETGHFTLGLKHMNCFVRVRSANPVTITVPNNVIFPPRTEITIMQEWSGQLTLVPASGVDLYIENNCRKSDGLRTAFTLHQTWTNKWFGVGRFAS